MDSTVTIVGNLTRDPELQFTPNGASLCKFSVAVNRVWYKDQQKQEETSFYNVVTWGDLANNVSASVQKGDRVIVSGRLQQRSWDDADSGQKRSVVEIVADEVGPSLRFALSEVQRVQRERTLVGATAAPADPGF